jgi:DNA-binding transcriptional LysR family regulator
MPLNLHALRLFAAVARHRSFSRAAEALHISQPAVSKTVHAFELQIGTRLLDRGAPGGVGLTEAGTRLARHAATLFAAEADAEEELRRLRGLETGTLTIGASTTIATYMLPPTLGAFHRRFPGVTLRLSTANTRDIVEQAVARELDLALVEGPVDNTALVATPWRMDTLALIAAPRHRLARAAPIRLEDLAEAVLILREPGSGTREVVLETLAAAKVAPGEMLEVGGTEAAKQLVASGLGLAFVSEAAAADQIALGRLATVPIQGFILQRMLSRLDLPGRQPSAAAAAFSRMLEMEAIG